MSLSFFPFSHTLSLFGGDCPFWVVRVQLVYIEQVFTDSEAPTPIHPRSPTASHSCGGRREGVGADS